jgi:uncharacterized protein with HEPN domain
VRDDRLYLEYIQESIARVEQYARRGETVFNTDPMVQDAVLRRMETLADAAAHLSDGVKARHRDVRWRQLTDFRNALAHAYAEIRLDLVWRAVTQDLATLKIVVEEELTRLRASDSPDDGGH